jgi:nucleoside-diphosphate-sugar epimerase
LKVLFVGGTGDISTSVSKYAVEQGIDLYLLNRGQTSNVVSGATVITGDVRKPDEVRRALNGLRFDAVVNWVAFVPEDIERDIELFRGLTRQYIFISSASAYHKPPLHPVITESTPLHNPYLEYSRNKQACEERLMLAYRQEGFPATIVRPSHTYAHHIPSIIGGDQPYALAERMLNGWPVIVHGDGSSLWTMTHAEDFARGFVGLLGHPLSIGQAIHITSDDVLNWNQIHHIIADALGVEAKIIHIPSDFIARVNPSVGAGLLGDKTWSAVFDNSKIKTLVPGYKAVIPFHQGIHKVLAWFNEDERRKKCDPQVHSTMDQIIRAYRAATD